MSSVTLDAKRRVKLYALNENRQWDDKGTGHVTSCYHEPLDGMSLLVNNEIDGSLLLESKIQISTNYQKQQGSLIVWTENDNYDLALSFQERDGCNEIWEKICQVQGRDPSLVEQFNDEEQEELRIDLVECDQNKLHLIIEQIIAHSQTARKRDALSAEYIENDYIQKLIDIFKKAEEAQDIKTLHQLYDIFKQLFLYDRPTLTEAMVADPILMDIIGIFEYEPAGIEETAGEGLSRGDSDDTTSKSSSTNLDQSQQESNADPQPEQEPKQDQDQKPDQDSNLNQNEDQVQDPNETITITKTSASKLITNRKKHREFLENETNFKEVIPFGNEKLVDKIHQTYRVQYLQSSVLPTPSLIEDNAFSSVTNLLFFNKVEIVSMIRENEEFLQKLFNQIISGETCLDKKRDSVLFLREYCIFSQTIQQKDREDFFKTLASLKILSAVEVALSSDDPEIKKAAIDIFTYLVEYSPHMTREHAVQQKEGLIDPPNSDLQTANILKLVIEHITTDSDPELGTAIQLSCIIRILLDPENMPGDAFGKHSFLEFFYFSCMQPLTEPIKLSTTSSGDILPIANDRKNAQLLSIMLELLTFFMEHHFTELRSYVAASDLLVRIMSLIKSRHKFLVLTVVRFFRKLIATKDTFYQDLIIKDSLFGPVIQVLKNNNRRYNLLDSAILELFEYIQNEELINIIDHVLTEYGPFLDSIDYVNTFKMMRQKRELFQYDIQMEEDDSDYEFAEPQFKKKKLIDDNDEDLKEEEDGSE